MTKALRWNGCLYGRPQEHPKYKPLLRDLTRNRVMNYKHTYDVWRNWLDAMDAYLFRIETGDEVMVERLDRYTAEEGAEFARLMGEYTDICEDCMYQDILGALFMEIEVSSVQAGQFFTPYHLCVAMAKMTFNKASFDAAILENGYVSVCDPACGSGAQLLAFAEVVEQELGPGATRYLRLYGQDIDIRCVQMTKIQLRMNGLDHLGRLIRASNGEQRYEPDEANRAPERCDDDQPTREESEGVRPHTQRPAGDPEQRPRRIHEAPMAVAAGERAPAQATFEFW